MKKGIGTSTCKLQLARMAGCKTDFLCTLSEYQSLTFFGSELFLKSFKTRSFALLKDKHLLVLIFIPTHC